MPTLTAHFDIALQAEERLRHPTVGQHLGSFLLGCVTPDIRILTRGHRDDTHFAPISCTTIGEGVRLMLQRYPRLVQARELSLPTQSFVAGYIAHLVADEAWIIHVYRPFFGNSDVFPSRLEGNIMDRALQLEMERQARERLNGLEKVRQHLARAEAGVEIGFISAQTLAQWREWVTDATQWEFTWDRLRRLARRQGDGAEGDGEAIAEGFLQEVPQGLERIYARVPLAALESYHEICLQQFVRLAGEYLP